MRKYIFLYLVCSVFLFSCQSSNPTKEIVSDSTAVDLEEGVEMIPIQTPKGEFRVFTFDEGFAIAWWAGNVPFAIREFQGLSPSRRH